MAALEELPEQNCQKDVHGAYFALLLVFLNTKYKINLENIRNKYKCKIIWKLRSAFTSPVVVVSYVLHHG